MDNDNENKKESEAIREQMEDTRTALTEKLETLESKFADTMQGTTTAVTDTVETVKEAVQETMESVTGSFKHTLAAVKETFNLAHHVDRHPWPMVGGSVTLGFLIGSFWGRSASAAGPEKAAGRRDRDGVPRKSGQEPRAKERGGMRQAASNIAPELGKLVGLALGALGGMARDLVTRAAPQEIGEKLAHVVEDVTRKLGGELVSGPHASASNEDAENDMNGHDDSEKRDRRVGVPY